MVLKIDNVSKQFIHQKHKIDAVCNVSFEIAPGETVGLIGPNGAGKSTLMRMISTLMKPSSGNIWIDGYDVVTHPQKAKLRTGYVSLDTNLPEQMTGEQLLRYFASIYGLDRDTTERRIATWTERLSLQKYIQKPFGQLSSGNKQKISLARGLLHQPTFLLLDEPSNGLDILALGVLRDTLRSLKNEGTAILISSHILQDIQLCERLLVMHEGALIRNEPLAKIGEQLTSLEDYYLKAVGVR
jgi:ABC-type multidrug transport system ATPase subunit